MSSPHDSRPLVAHLVYRFDTGGLENGVINLINHLPESDYRHAVIALTESTAFSRRIARKDVDVIELRKPPGHALRIYPRLYTLLRRLKPAILHTRNLAALEAVVPALAAGISIRIHGEHGRDVGDFDGSNRKYQLLRRIYRPFVTHYVAVSRDLRTYLTSRVGVHRDDVTQIYNGVDTHRFRFRADSDAAPVDWPFNAPGQWVIGTVGRMETVKAPLLLARAFIRALETDPSQRARLRLVMIGEGSLRSEVQALLRGADVEKLCWLPGDRPEIPDILGAMDCFVLPSIGEGISNTILEAMATGLPVVATDVGGNAELVEAGRTGELVPAGDVEALARQILAYAHDTDSARTAGKLGRERAVRHFSLDTMIGCYKHLYDSQLAAARSGRRASAHPTRSSAS